MSTINDNKKEEEGEQDYYQLIRVPAAGSVAGQEVILEANLSIPKNAQGLVIFAHGSGSGRHSPRNRYVAQVLQDKGIGSLLIDLLTEREEEIDLQTRHLRFDIGLLSQRLIAATDWIINKQNRETEGSKVAFYIP